MMLLRIRYHVVYIQDDTKQIFGQPIFYPEVVTMLKPISVGRWMLPVLVMLVTLATTSGCMPVTNEKVDKPRSSKEASGRWSSIRGRRGQSSRSTYEIEGEKFEALWEITNVIGGKIKLQFQFTQPWDHGKVYRAVETAFVQEPDQPWFYPIEDTFLPCLRSAMQQIDREAGNDTGMCSNLTADMPYDCNVKVIDRGGGWFVECTATLVPGME
jgi:hypothetical protein